MSDGSGGSGGGGGVRDDGGARGAGPLEPQSLGSQEEVTSAPSLDWAVQWARERAAGTGTEVTAGPWSGTRYLWFWPSDVYCDCTAGGAGGGGWKIGPGVVNGTHPGLHGLMH